MSLITLTHKAIRTICLCLSFSCVYALQPSLTKHFQLHVKQQENELVLKWDIEPGTFLYKERIHFDNVSQGVQLGSINWPKAIPHTDKLGNSHQIYQHPLEVHLPYQSNISGQGHLTIQYQGCSLAGVCFPPQNTAVTFTIHSSSSSPHSSINKNIILECLSFLGIGILLAFTPCVLPMLPIMTRIVIGDRSQQSFKQTLGLSMAYVLGMALTYAMVGAVIANIGKNLFILMQQTWIMWSMAIVYIYFALATLGVVNIQMPERFQQKTMAFRSSLHSGRYLSALLMGSLSLLILSPCVTAPLLGALTYITQLGQVWRGSLALFMLGLGMGIPLMIFAISAGHWLPKAGGWMDNVKYILALLLLSISALLICRTTSSHLALLSWVAVLFVAFYLFKPQANHGKIAKILRSFIVLMLLTYAAVLSFGIANSSYLPWPFASKQQQHPNYVLHNQQSLNQVLSKQTQTPVLLYFSAKWCATCQYLETKVWSDHALSPLLKKTTWIKVDLTENSEEQTRLMQKYHVVAPPTVILLPPQGNASSQGCRLLGEDITISHLKKWEKQLGNIWALNQCEL